MLDQGIESTVSEQWTTSRDALVLSGRVAALRDIAQRLALPTAVVVEIRHGEAVLGLWGEPLVTYQLLKGRDPLERDHRSAN